MLIEVRTRYGVQWMNLHRMLAVSVVAYSGGTLETAHAPIDLMRRAGVMWVGLTRRTRDGATHPMWVNPARVRGVRVFDGFPQVDFAGRWERVVEPVDVVVGRINMVDVITGGAEERRCSDEKPG